MKSGFFIPLLVMLPNIVFMALNPKALADTQKANIVLEILENVGRYSTLLIPFFYSFSFSNRYSPTFTVLSGIAIALYYICWIRYFSSGQSSAMLHKAFIGIPFPMAIFPIVFFIASSYLLCSWPLFIASTFFGIFHIWVSAITLK